MDDHSQHHIWCNGHPDSPVKGCSWCDPVGTGGGGLWARYPYSTVEESDALMKKHFPENIVRA